MSNSFMNDIKDASNKVSIKLDEKEKKRIYDATVNSCAIYDEIMRQLTSNLYHKIADQINHHTYIGLNSIEFDIEINIIRRYLLDSNLHKKNIKIQRVFEKIVHEHDVSNDPNKIDLTCVSRYIEGPLKPFFIDLICESENENIRFKKLMTEWFKQMRYPESPYLLENNLPHLNGLDVSIVNKFKDTKLCFVLNW